MRHNKFTIWWSIFILMLVLCSCGGPDQNSQQPQSSNGEKQVEGLSASPTVPTTFPATPACADVTCFAPETVAGVRKYIDTWDSTHLFQAFTHRFTDMSQAKKYDFFWGIDPANYSSFRQSASNAFLTYYIMMSRDNGTFTDIDVDNRDLNYWKSAHPDWIIYECDGKTPSHHGDDKNIFLDISNPAVMQWQMDTYIKPASERGYDGIAVDNLDFENYYNLCGIYRDGKWVKIFDGVEDDAKWRAALINWLQVMQDSMHKLPHPLALIPNGGMAFGRVMKPEYLKAFQDAVKYSDGLLDESGFTYYGRPDTYLADDAWVKTQEFIRDMQKQNKPYYSLNQLPNSNFKPEDVSWVLASYLMSKEHLSSVYIAGDQDYGYSNIPDLFTIQVGLPESEMYLDQDVYWRRFQHAMVLVNHSSTTTRVVKVDPNTYTDSQHKAIGDTITLAPHTGVILLKKS